MLFRKRRKLDVIFYKSNERQSHSCCFPNFVPLQSETLQQTPHTPGTRQGDTNSTNDLTLVSPKLAPWTHSETLALHGSDHLPVVFSLQKPEIEPRKKSQFPYKYGKSETGVVSKLRTRKPAHTTNPRQKTIIQPRWWNKETQEAWTDKWTMVKVWQRERSKPHPDLTIKAHMEEKTEVFMRVASEAKDRPSKGF